MRIRISDPWRLPALLAFLRERPDCIAERVGPSLIGVSLLGSLVFEENATELEERLQTWRAANGGVLVELVA